MEKLIIENYLNKYRIDEIREHLENSPIGVVKPYQLKIEVIKVYENSFKVLCNVYWMGTIALINHKIKLTDKEIRKIKLLNL